MILHCFKTIVDVLKKGYTRALFSQIYKRVID